ncbi:MAG: hypothetical protein Q4C61_01480 [Lachnospiraceae bacterium]|nr:hypothetical protein [Lachnospiraceae bacterium]
MVFTKEIKRYLMDLECELIEYQEFHSKLSDKDLCFLCGDDTESMIGYYRQFDTIGLISLNDWYMIDFLSCTGNGSQPGHLAAVTSISQVNTGQINIFADRVSSGHRTALRVTWNDSLTLDKALIEENLCPICLTKVADSLTISKRRYEKKKPIPFCLVDFQTMKLYSLQDWRTEYCIRDYWVDLQYYDDGMSIKAYY